MNDLFRGLGLIAVSDVPLALGVTGVDHPPTGELVSLNPDLQLVLFVADVLHPIHDLAV
jgi:hypothetical protein